MEQNLRSTEEIELDLGEILRALLNRLGIILLVGVLGMLAAVIGTKLMITPVYQSTTKMYVLTRQDGSTLTSNDIQTSTFLTKDYTELIKSRTVIENVIAELELNMNYNQLLEKLVVDSPTDTRIISINVQDEDPYVAAEIANAIRDVASEHIKNVMDIEAVKVVEDANIPTSPISPNISRNGLLGGLAGIFVSAAVVLLIYLTDDSIKNSEDIERYLNLSTLGSIPITESEKRGKQKSKKKNRLRGQKA